MRIAIATLSLLLLAGSPTRHDLATIEGLAALQGRWQCTSLERVGMKSDGGSHSWTFEHGRLLSAAQNGLPAAVYEVTVDARQTPARITLRSTGANGVWNGVYRLRGGVLQVRLRSAAEPPPLRIEGVPRGTESLATYKRVRR